jgi:hypothetical protein
MAELPRVIISKGSYEEHSGLDDEFRGRSTFVDFRPNGGCTVSTQIFVFIPFRQDQKQFLPNRNSCLASWAIERGGFKLFITGFVHVYIIRKISEPNNENMDVLVFTRLL